MYGIYHQCHRLLLEYLLQYLLYYGGYWALLDGDISYDGGMEQWRLQPQQIATCTYHT